MEKVLCFLCDTYGILDGKTSNTLEDYQKFADTLLQLKEVHEVDSIIFSFLSEDSYESVQEASKLVSDFFDSSITLGKQFFEDGFIEQWRVQVLPRGKFGQLIGYLDEVRSQYDIKGIYYTDSLESSHDMISFLISENDWKEPFYSIMSRKQGGLSEVNQLLQEQINKKEKVFHKEVRKNS